MINTHTHFANRFVGVGPYASYQTAAVQQFLADKHQAVGVADAHSTGASSFNKVNQAALRFGNTPHTNSATWVPFAGSLASNTVGSKFNRQA